MKINDLDTMTIQHVPLDPALIQQYSQRDRAYQLQPELFQPFIPFQPNYDQFTEVIEEKQGNYSQALRAAVCEVLGQQYQRWQLEDDHSLQQLSKLRKDNSYAIITAHQTCLFTGPLYVIYKIASTIAMANKLTELYPDLHFVPIYVMGSEDHDIDEINHLYLYNKKYTWQPNQHDCAAGRLPLSGISEIIDEVSSVFEHDAQGAELAKLLRSAYDETYSLAEATARFIHALFSRHGLIIADLDHKSLKRAALPLFERELTESFSYPLVSARQEALAESGFAAQVYPRGLNLFYLTDEKRSRIEREGDDFIIDGERISQESLLREVQEHPDRLSPNVILRPLYQQWVLPGIAYIGGGAEVAYWMEIQPIFESVSLAYPMLVRRDSALWINSRHYERMKDLGLETSDLLKDLHEAQKDYLAEHAEEDWSLDELRQQFSMVFDRLAQDIHQIDPGLIKMSEGYQQQTDNFLDKVETKLRRTIKSKHDVSMNRMDKLWQDLFPNNGLQERQENFLKLYARHGLEFIDLLIRTFDPLHPAFHIFIEED